eukprot:UN05048
MRNQKDSSKHKENIDIDKVVLIRIICIKGNQF